MGKTVTIETESGEAVEVRLCRETGRLGACLRIDGIPHHIEQMLAADLTEHYCVDRDPDYVPRTDESGFCYLVVPFSE